MGDIAVETSLPDDPRFAYDQAQGEASSFSSEEDECSNSVDAAAVAASSPDKDLCGGFRLFPSRPSFLSVDENDTDNEMTIPMEQRSPLAACIAPPTSARKRWPILESWNNNDNNNSGDDDEDNEEDRNNFWCNPQGLKNNINSQQQQPLTLSPSFAWLTHWMDDQQQQQTSASAADAKLYNINERALSADDIAPATDLSRPRQVWIVTTAALPWMTGTAINPLLRAAYLVQRYHEQSSLLNATASTTATTTVVHDEDGIFYDSTEEEIPAAATSGAYDDWKVTLVIPWLERAEDRVELYGSEWADSTPEQQEAYMRHWLSHTVPVAAERLHMEWYRARYYTPYRSIFPTQDLVQWLQNQVPTTTAEGYSALDDPHCPVCILEEPEHLFLYRAMQSSAAGGASGGTASSSVVDAIKGTSPPQQQQQQVLQQHPLAGFYTLSIIHTNYKSYAAQGGLGFVSEMLAGALCAVVAQGYSDKIVKLSATLQAYAPHKETVVNVHGIRQDFLNVPPPTGNDMYFIGKLLWAKGLDKLLRYQRLYAKRSPTGEYFSLDVYGSGPDQEEIQTAFGDRPVTFCGRLDHAALPTKYKIFCNPSISEVLCTTSAEALAMNKFVLMPRHPSNAFFEQFPNALLYRTPQEFCSLLLYAQSNDPMPLSDELRYCLSWQAATERLIASAATSSRELARLARFKASRDMKCYEWHASVCRGRLGKTLQKSFFGTFEEEDQEDKKR